MIAKDMIKMIIDLNNDAKLVVNASLRDVQSEDIQWFK